MKLIFAQGNPGKQYETTRHNVGFIVLDAIAERESASWKTDSKMKAEIASISLGGEKVLLVKPLSFYNDTGLVARALVDFYKLAPADDVLVIHDELALPFGTIRVRAKGSDAGNNGIKSLNAHLGGDYWRLRIGVWNELRDRMNDADFVLSRFTSEELDELKNNKMTVLHGLIEDFVKEQLENTSYNAS